MTGGFELEQVAVLNNYRWRFSLEYVPQDGTWVFGDSLIDLLDIYSVWALRHLHNETLGRWPGPQAVPHPYERMLELGDNELCGCGRSNKLYRNCCKPSDSRKSVIAEAIKFFIWTNWSVRQPPDFVLQFMVEQNVLPDLSSVFF